jgi:uncharacterized peroxidase-related enzyme
MRLPEIEKGDTFKARTLIGLISLVSGMRLPDAARTAFYHADFLDGAFGAWTQRAMRGPSAWTVFERELMAAMVAHWNTCPFCVGAHGAIAIKGLPQATLDAALADYRTADLSPELKATLGYLEKLTRTPDALTSDDAHAVLATGATRTALEDAIAVASVFAVITRYANALAFAIPSDTDFDKAATMLLKRGYA